MNVRNPDLENGLYMEISSLCSQLVYWNTGIMDSGKTGRRLTATFKQPIILYAGQSPGISSL
jgi:hypothetical protein